MLLTEEMGARDELARLELERLSAERAENARERARLLVEAEQERQREADERLMVRRALRIRFEAEMKAREDKMRRAEEEAE